MPERLSSQLMQNYLFVRFVKPSQSEFLSYSDIIRLNSSLWLAI